MAAAGVPADALSIPPPAASFLPADDATAAPAPPGAAPAGADDAGGDDAAEEAPSSPPYDSASFQALFTDAYASFWESRDMPPPACGMGWCRLTLDPWTLWERVQARRAAARVRLPLLHAHKAPTRLQRLTHVGLTCAALLLLAAAQRCGGYDGVTARKLWRTIGDTFGPPGALVHHTRTRRFRRPRLVCNDANANAFLSYGAL
jgi:hypothetical protein